MGGTSLISIGKDDGMYLKLINAGLVDSRLKRGETIAKIEHDKAEDSIHEVTEEFFQLDSTNSIRGNQKASQTSLFMEQIQKAVTPNIPDQKKQRCWHLLLKHANVFSVDKTDLCLTTDFEHRNHLEENELLYQTQFKIPKAHRDFIEATMAKWPKLGVVQ